jgi:hypothetical protein
MSSFDRVEVRKYLLCGYAIFPIFDLSLGYRQIKLSSKDYLDDVYTIGVSSEYTFMSFGLTNTFASFIQNVSLSLEYLDKFVVEPIDDILTFSMSKEVHIEQLALMLETFKNHLCVNTKYVFWMLEVTFSGSRAFDESCCRGSEKSSLFFPWESSQVSHACAEYPLDGRLLPPFA